MSFADSNAAFRNKMTGRLPLIAVIVFLIPGPFVTDRQEGTAGFPLQTVPFRAATGITGGITGSAGLVITAVNDDDSISGIVRIQLDQASRTRLGEATGAGIDSVPASITLDQAQLKLRKGTSCPEIRIAATGIIAGAGKHELKIDDLIFRIVETPDQRIQLFCAWVRQINAGRHRLGIIKAINRMISESNGT